MKDTKASTKNTAKEKIPQKGTFLSLGVVLGVILLTYIVLYSLFMARV